MPHLLRDISALDLVIHLTHAAPLVIDVGRVESGKNFKVNTEVLLAVLSVDLLQLVLNRGEVYLQSRMITAAWFALDT
jgi:hypothetical protein